MNKAGPVAAAAAHRRSASKKRRLARDHALCDVTSLPEEHCQQQQQQQGKMSKRQPLAERSARLPGAAATKAQTYGYKFCATEEPVDRHGKSKVFEETEHLCRPARASKTAALAKLRTSDVFYEPMEMDTSSISMLALEVSVPNSILDIDYHDDYFLCPEYAQDIMGYLKDRERQSVLPTDYLIMSPEVTSQMRGILMDWLIQVQDHEQLEEETLELSVALTDQYLARASVPIRQVQLVGVTALLIAAKYVERFPPMVSTLCSLTAGTYNTFEVLDTEKAMLCTLQFDVSFPVAVVFLQRFLLVHPHDVQVEQLARYSIDLSLPSLYMVSVLPSMLAASALYVARKVWLPEEPEVWTPALTHYTGYGPEDIMDVIRMLAKMLLRAGVSKYQAARDKHSQEENYGAISQNPVLDSHPALVLLAKSDTY